MNGKPDNQLLESIGNALYGRSWQSDMARDLGLNDARNIRHWLSGNRDIPDGVWRDLAAVLHRRGNQSLSLAESLDKQLNGAQ